MSKGRLTNMLEIRTVIHRLRNGDSNRLIEREIGVDRAIIRNIKNLAMAHQWLDLQSPMPSDDEISKVWIPKPKSFKDHPLDPYRHSLEEWRKEGLSATVIYQLLNDKCSCNPQMVRRYLKKHFPKTVDPVMVRQTLPGQYMDIDFGYLGEFYDDNGLKRKAWVFTFRLRHSRRVYRQVVLNQKLETFLLCHIHAFESFSGVPQYVVLDNCKAAVIRSTVDNDMIMRSYQELAEHYGFVISPCLPRTPEHKGGVEGDVKYIKGNFLPYFRQKFKERNIVQPRLTHLIEGLEQWGREIADVHIVNGVGRSPQEIFKAEEQQYLRPLPNHRWEPTFWSQCTVRRDWRIMFDSAYYSVPYHLIGKMVQVCSTSSLVRIFYDHQEVAYHDRAKQKWEYKRKTEYAPPLQEEVLQCSREGLLALADSVGPYTYKLVEGILSHPSIDKLRPVRLLLRLATKYSQERLEIACQRACKYKMFSYSSVKNILDGNLETQRPEQNCSTEVVKLPHFRFVRNPADYRSTTAMDAPRKQTFLERLEEAHPHSKHGNAMLGVYHALLADQIAEEEIEQVQREKNLP